MTNDPNPEKRVKRISDDIEKMLLEQAQLEMTASITYLSMSYFFESRGMTDEHFMQSCNHLPPCLPAAEPAPPRAVLPQPLLSHPGLQPAH